MSEDARISAAADKIRLVMKQAEEAGREVDDETLMALFQEVTGRGGWAVAATAFRGRGGCLSCAERAGEVSRGLWALAISSHSGRDMRLMRLL